MMDVLRSLISSPTCLKGSKEEHYKREGAVCVNANHQFKEEFGWDKSKPKEPVNATNW